ncbi:ThiF family adenylyltransferase [Paenibacillus sp. CN-4]|uniref:ThiF family adenylyltransferase n=1 Tax=Paenibacillus nanchangensis TaxID=3348343 RepID=UPI00397A7462
MGQAADKDKDKDKDKDNGEQVRHSQGSGAGQSGHTEKIRSNEHTRQNEHTGQLQPSSKQGNGRYSRQIRFHPFGREGQAALSASAVLVVGAGALGTGIAETLVRGGVGRLVLCDRDYVEWSNLQRQQLYSEEDARDRTPKAAAAAVRLRAINSEVAIETHIMDARAEELEALLDGIDLMMDATDNFDTRLIINDLAQKHGIPWIYGACVGSYGVTYTILPGETPCLNCLMGTVPLGGDTCDTAGILPQTVQMVVANQTMEAFKLLAGKREALRKRLLMFDVWRNEYQEIGVQNARKQDCPSCGAAPSYPYLSAANAERTEVLCGRDTVQIRPPKRERINLEAAAQRLKQLGDGTVEVNPFLLSLNTGTLRLVVFADGRALVHGTNDTAAARSFYHRYFG